MTTEDRRLAGLVSTHRYRAKDTDGTNSFNAAQWVRLVEICGGRCCCCLKEHQLSRLVVDHIKPLSRGGDNNIRNIQPLCAACNIHKRTDEIDFRGNCFDLSMLVEIENIERVIQPFQCEVDSEGKLTIESAAKMLVAHRTALGRKSKRRPLRAEDRKTTVTPRKTIEEIPCTCDRTDGTHRSSCRKMLIEYQRRWSERKKLRKIAQESLPETS